MDQNHVSALRQKHEALDQKITEEEARPNPDTILIHQAQKREIAIKG